MPSSGPSLTSSTAHCPHPALWRVSETTQPWTGGRAGAGVAIADVEAWTRRTLRKGMLGSQSPQCWGGRGFTLTSRPLFCGTLPRSGGSPWNRGLRRMEEPLPKLQEREWNGTDGSASVCPGGVNAALRAIHVLSGQLCGHLRGQAVGQGSGGRGHMLLKAVDARLFGGLGAG